MHLDAQSDMSRLAQVSIGESLMPILNANLFGACTPIKAVQATIVPENCGDEEKDAWCYDVWAGGVVIATFQDQQKAYQFCMDKGLEVA